MVLVLAVAGQALVYAQARIVAETAAADGARAAASSGAAAGIARSDAILAAAGRLVATLRTTTAAQADELTVTVSGRAPSLFALSLLLPAVHASTSLPLERFPSGEAVR